LLTRTSIARHARIGLYRALNIGNIIAFVGSGATVRFGRPTWRELVLRAYEHTRKLAEAPRLAAANQTLREDLKELLDTVHALAANKAMPGETLKLLAETCENIVRRIDESSRGGQMADPTAHEKLREHLREAIAQPRQDREERLAIDPIHDAFELLGIRRFLTINYDLEIERFLQERRGFRGRAVGPSFDDLLGSGTSSQTRILDYRVTATDALGRTAFSKTLRDESVGELVTFACMPRGGDPQVFHLHGRADDPARFIYSERDYQRAYLRLDNTRRTFHEALDTLFLGNDVVFIGVGMNEGDLLRPLRQFVAEERTPDTSARRIFALLPYDGEQKALEQALELKIRYGVLSIFFGEDASYYRKRLLDLLLKKPDRAHLEAQLGKLRSAICDAQKAEPPPRALRDEAVAGISESTPPAELVRRLLLRDVPKRLSLIAPMGRRLLSCLENAADFPASSEIEACSHELMTNALCQSMQDLRTGKEQWWRDWNEDAREARARYPRVIATPPFQEAPEAAAPVVWVRHQAEYTYPQGASRPSALLNFAKAQARKQYGASPEAGRRILRLAGSRGCGKGVLFQELLRPAEAASAAPGTAALKENWALLFPEPHAYAGAFFAHASYSPEFTSVIGGLVRFIAGRTANADDIQMAERILHREAQDRTSRHLPAGDQPAVECSGDFEWFPRLLRDPSSDGDSPQPLWREDSEPDRLTQLRRVLERFAKSTTERVLVCLAGLDRLCDKDGVAYHPMHRAFFGILVGEAYNHLPLDIVLIAGSPDTPIHFLSESLDGAAADDGVRTRQEPSLDGGNDLLAEAFEAPRTRLAAWPRLPRLPLEERTWLNRSGHWYLSCSALKEAPILQSFLSESVALDTWLSLCAAECFRLRTGRARRQAAYCRAAGPSYPPRPNWIWQSRGAWIANLEGAAKRGGLWDLLDEMFLTYRQLDAEKDRLPRSAILRHLCLFTLPIEPEVLLACPQVVAQLARAAPKLEKLEAFGPERLAWLKRHLDHLVRRGLVIRICVPSAASSGSSGRDPLRQRYVLHAQLREYLAHQMKFTLPDGGERNYHDVSLYCAQPRDLATPSEAHYRLIAGVVESLVSTCRSRLEWFYKKRSRNPAAEKDRPRPQHIMALPQMIRAAFNILRDSFSIGSLARLPRLDSNLDEREEPYEVYRSWLRHILNLAIAMEEVGGKPDRHDRYQDKATLRHYLEEVSREERFPLRDPLYQNEVIWLYNERALSGLFQGRLYDALPSFERALRFTHYSADRDSQTDDAHLAAERRVLLNFAIAEIEYGRIQRARQRLDALVARARRPGLRHPSMTPILALGYIGLCDHLGGQLESAITAYRSVIAVAERRQLLRTASIFHRHCADALRVAGSLDEAEKHLQLAIFAAAGEEQKDLHAHTLIAKARLARDSGKPERLKGALELLDQAEQYAEDMGLVKARVEALKVRAELILAQGETEYAGRLAARAIALASRDGMRLRRLAALVTYARVLRARSQTSLATTVLDRTSKEASRLRYRLKAELADRELRELVSQVPSAPEPPA
jgi:tetratricopeptide (TPR) repeat protein